MTAPTRYATARLLSFIRESGARVTCRAVYRRGLGCRNAADARARLDFLVTSRIGHWEFSRPSKRGGRPKRMFVLAPAERARTRRLQYDALLTTLRFGLDDCTSS